MAVLNPLRFSQHLQQLKGDGAVALFFVGAICSPAHAQWTISSSSDSLLHTSNIAAKAFFSDWRGAYVSGNHATVYNQNQLQIQQGRLHFSYVQRQQLLLRFSNDTATLVNLTNKKQNLPVGETYHIHLQANALQAQGPRFGWQIIKTKGLNVTTAISFYRATQPLYGQLHGQVRVLSEKDYEYENINIDYVYDTDYLFDRNVSPAYGLGRGVELAINWQINTFYQLDVQINDINAAIDWSDVSGTRARLTSDTKTYDENGYVRISPGFSGKHYTSNRHQVLPWHGRARLLLQAKPRLHYFADWRYLNEHLYVSLGMRKPVGEFGSEISYELSSRAWLLGLTHKYGSIRLGADHYQWQQLRLASLQVQLTLLQF